MFKTACGKEVDSKLNGVHLDIFLDDKIYRGGVVSSVIKLIDGVQFLYPDTEHIKLGFDLIKRIEIHINKDGNIYELNGQYGI